MGLFDRLMRLQGSHNGGEELEAAVQDLERLGQMGRVSMWTAIFAWALPDRETRMRFPEFLETEIQSRKDKKMISQGAAEMKTWDRQETKRRKKQAKHVMRAFVASMQQGKAKERYYVQGMNDIAFVLLEVFNGSEENAFSYLSGILTKLLRDEKRDDVFFQALLRESFPDACKVMEAAGMEPGKMGLEWASCLFTCLDTTLDSLLACWDISFLKGASGIYSVILSLFSVFAEELVVSKATRQDIETCISTALSGLSSKDIYNRATRYLKDIDETISTLKIVHAKKKKPVPKLPISSRPMTARLDRNAKQKKSQQVSLTARTCSKYTPRDSYLREWEQLQAAEANVQEKRTSNNNNNNNNDDLSGRKTPRFHAHDWLQAWDEDHQAYYYTRIDNFTSWDAPEVGFITVNGALRIPLPATGAWQE